MAQPQTLPTRQRRCPECGSEQVVPIRYGFPTPELAREAEQGRVALGGCCLGPQSPRWLCKACEHEFGKMGRSTY